MISIFFESSFQALISNTLIIAIIRDAYLPESYLQLYNFKINVNIRDFIFRFMEALASPELLR